MVCKQKLFIISSWKLVCLEIQCWESPALFKMHFKKAQKFDKNFKFHSAYINFVPICIFKKKKIKYAILQFS